MSEPKITIEELLRELDSFRSEDVWTEEMDKIVLAARDSKNPVSFRNLFAFFEKHKWGHSATAIRRRYLKLHRAK